MRFPISIDLFESPFLKSGILPAKQAFLEVRIPRKAKIGEILRLARYLQQLSQEEVADAVGEIQKTISRVELGEVHQFQLVGRLAQFYQISLDEYFQESDPDS